MPSRLQRAQRGAADGSGGADEEHALRCGHHPMILGGQRSGYLPSMPTLTP
jgi:hypothetical protein